MPILTEDIKLLKSAVMADTSDGGGAMTGIAVIDGQSNNLFPDTSELDRALGRVNIREIYGVAHTADTDTLLGAHTIITDAPDDPLVHCTLMAAPSWGATRDAFREAIERYLVKGPRVAARMYDTHYAGSLQVRLVSFVPTTFPVGGDAIVLRNPSGQEQYVRVLRTVESFTQIAVNESSGTVVLPAYVAVCDLGQALLYDFIGPQPARVLNEASFAQVYSTNVSGGARFFGIKPIGTAGAVGDYSVTLAGGIFAPLVPAATIESPIIDQYPLILRQSLSRTALRSVTLPAVSLIFGPGTVLTFPTAIEPLSLSITHGGTLFTDDGLGGLKQGTTVVGEVNYKAKTVTLSAGAPAYGNASNAITYKPATLAGAGTYSDYQDITAANQGLAYTYAFEPPPAPGTFTLSYMAQGRWYDLQDNGNGKLSGADSSYGVGTINYVTGSIGFTLGAIPDVGSALIYQWGNSATAVPVLDAVPARLSTLLTLPNDVAVNPSTLTLAWSRGGTNYTAACAADGTLSGGATGTVGQKLISIVGGNRYVSEIDFAPSVFPDGLITVAWAPRSNKFTDLVNNGGGNYTLGRPPAPGSVLLRVLTVPQAGFDVPGVLFASDRLQDGLLRGAPGESNFNIVLGTVNYSTGVIVISPTVALSVYENVIQTYAASGGNTLFYEKKVLRAAHVVTLVNTTVTEASHTTSATATAQSQTFTPVDWTFKLPVLTGLALRTDALLFEVGNEVYHSQGGVLRKSWNAAATTLSAPVGSAVSNGTVSLNSLPANGTNAVSLVNAARDATGGLTVGQGTFRVASAPLKTGVFQIQARSQIGSGNGTGVITGGGWAGSVDYQRGIVKWNRTTGLVEGWAAWQVLNPISADQLSYNAVFLQYLPLDGALLGLETARLPLDGKVPIFRSGGVVVVHNTQTLVLPNPLVKGTAYALGRTRIASVRVKTVTGATVSGLLYTTALDTGSITFPVASDLTGLAQPFSVEHRIEDMMLTSAADISGKLSFTRALTHAFPANTSYASGALLAGDVFGRVFSVFDQSTWTGEWSDTRIGADTLASYNTIDFPLTTTNRGAVTERWAIIFTSSSAFRIVGEKYGQVGIGDVNTITQPNNTATGTPFFSIPIAGWGGGWAAGNVLRLNTAACGTAIGVVRTVLQGPDTLASDKFTLAFRGDVNA